METVIEKHFFFLLKFLFFSFVYLGISVFLSNSLNNDVILKLSSFLYLLIEFFSIVIFLDEWTLTMPKSSLIKHGIIFSLLSSFLNYAGMVSTEILISPFFSEFGSKIMDELIYHWDISLDRAFDVITIFYNLIFMIVSTFIVAEILPKFNKKYVEKNNKTLSK